MSTTLTQSAAASFQDRPAQGGVGLQVSMATGDAGSYLPHDMGAEQPVLHARFLFSPWGLAGGRVVVLAGLDGLGAEVLRLTYDADSHELSVWLPGGLVLSADLDGVITWQCVEVAVDTVAGQADLWVNGVLADQTSGDLSSSTVQTLWFGAPLKETGLAGDLFLDELCLADSYIGPVIVSPNSPYADDPAGWLVVYNTADSDAAAWAESYRQARGIPFANLLALNLPTTEMIDAAQYDDLVTAIDSYLTLNSLGGQVMGILLGYRVPGYVDFAATELLDAVPSLMQTGSTDPGPVTNANASPITFQRLTYDDLAGDRFTARIDGPDLASANQLVDRATTLIASGLGDGDDGVIYFDPFVGSNPSYQSTFAGMLSWALGLDGMRTRLPIVLSGDPSGNTEANFSAVSGDGFFWGWSSTLPSPDIFTDPVGRRALSVQLYLDGASATTVRNALPANWIDTPIDAGYAAAIASSRSAPVSSIPDPRALFGALREGWTLAEAWYVAQPKLRDKFYLVGDPLMTAAMPREGFEVFGPLQNLKSLDPSAPALVLRENELTTDLSTTLPGDGDEAIYVVRHTDTQGRAEASTGLVRVVNVNGIAKLPAVPPIWPDAVDWPVVLEAGQVVFTACWAGPLGQMRLGTVELLSQPEGGAEIPIAQPLLESLSSHIGVTAAAPSQKNRYRWRITSTDGVVYHTPWSAWVEPAAAPTQTLQQIGANT